jgi:hypothetical protein
VGVGTAVGVATGGGGASATIAGVNGGGSAGSGFGFLVLKKMSGQGIGLVNHDRRGGESGAEFAEVGSEFRQYARSLGCNAVITGEFNAEAG